MIKEIESVSTRFLWAGPVLSRKMHAVSWDKVCKSYKEGGLHIRKVKEMNGIDTIKHLRWLISNKESLLSQMGAQ